MKHKLNYFALKYILGDNWHEDSFKFNSYEYPSLYIHVKDDETCKVLKTFILEMYSPIKSVIIPIDNIEKLMETFNFLNVKEGNEVERIKLLLSSRKDVNYILHMSPDDIETSNFNKMNGILSKLKEPFCFYDFEVEILEN